MPRVDPEAFSDTEVRQLYLAAKLDEAQRVEAFLDEQGVDYVVRVEPYVRISLFFFWPMKFQGAAFYVEADEADRLGAALRSLGLLGVVDEEPSKGSGE